MSDQNQDARELARGIAQWAAPEELVGDEDAERDWIEGAIRQWEAPILVMLDKREAALQAELHRALGEGARLRQVAERAEREITERLDTEYEVTGDRANLALFRSALTSSPLSERAGVVVGAVLRLVSGLPGESVEEHEARLERDYSTMLAAGVALRAELAKGGEGDA